jgi:glycosyltransferase involved in cell wall biosynthesis
MAMKKPLLASDIGGHREMVIPGVNGAFFHSEDADNLAAIMGQWLDDPDQMDQLAESAGKWVNENRSWKALGKQYLQIYDSLVQGDNDRQSN